VKSLPITLSLPENVPPAPELTLESAPPPEKKALSRKGRRL
jgi:hypothetical protein